MSLIKKSLLILLSVVLLVGCDLQTKNVAKSILKGEPKVSMLSGTVIFVYAENSGGMLSFGSELSDIIRFLIFRVFVGLALLGMLIYTIIARNIKWFKLFAFVLIISGGLGNLIDRIFHDGVVTDFVVIKAFNLQTGIFNAADMFVMTGMFIILVGNIFIKRQKNVVETE